MDLGERIKARREILGFSQEQLAEASGVSRTRISDIECGCLPQVQTMLRLERALGLDPGDLLRDTQA